MGMTYIYLNDRNIDADVEVAKLTTYASKRGMVLLAKDQPHTWWTAPPDAAASLVPSLVRNSTWPSSTMKLTGSTTGKALTDSPTHPATTLPSRMRQSARLRTSSPLVELDDLETPPGCCHGGSLGWLGGAVQARRSQDLVRRGSRSFGVPAVCRRTHPAIRRACATVAPWYVGLGDASWVGLRDGGWEQQRSSQSRVSSEHVRRLLRAIRLPGVRW